MMSSQVACRDKIEGSNGGELGDPEMFAARNIAALQAKIGYRNVMSRQAQQLQDILKRSALRKEQETAMKKEMKAQRAIQRKLRQLDDKSSEGRQATPKIMVKDEGERPVAERRQEQKSARGPL